MSSIYELPDCYFPVTEELGKHHNPEMSDQERVEQLSRFQSRRSLIAKDEATWLKI